MSIKVRSHRGKQSDTLNGEGRDTPLEHVTGQPAGNSRVSLDCTTLAVHYVTQGANPEAGSTDKKINLTGHSARRGDLIRITSTANGILEYEIAIDSVTANEIFLVGNVSANFDIADTIDILRPVTLRATTDGGISQGPLSFNRDTGGGPSVVEVYEDTVTPANNIPLPVKLTGVTGDITITSNDLNVQLGHVGANPDSVQVGDGTEIMLINASGEAQVADDTARTSLANIDGKLVDGNDIGDVTINNGAAGAAVNIQDGGNVISVDDGAGSLTVDAIDLDIRDLTHVSDSVSIGDGTEIAAVNVSNELQVADDTVRTTLSTLNAKFGTIGRQAEGASAAVVLSSQDKGVLDAIQTAVEIIDNSIAGSETQVDIVDAGPIATEATLAAQSAKLPASLGPKASASSFSVTFASNEPDIGVASDDVVAFTLLDFSSSNVTAAGYTELIGDIGGIAGKKVQISTQTGEAMYLATGAIAAETDRMIIPAGGFAHVMEVTLAVNARLSLKKVTAGTISSGTIIINVMG